MGVSLTLAHMGMVFLASLIEGKHLIVDRARREATRDEYPANLRRLEDDQSAILDAAKQLRLEAILEFRMPSDFAFNFGHYRSLHSAPVAQLDEQISLARDE